MLPSGGADFYLPIGAIHVPNITSDRATGACLGPEYAGQMVFGVTREDAHPDSQQYIAWCRAPRRVPAPDLSAASAS